MTCGTGKVLSSTEKSFLFQVLILINREIKNGFLKKTSRTILLALERKQHGGQAENLGNCYKEGDMDKEEKTMPFELGPEQAGIFNNGSQ